MWISETFLYGKLFLRAIFYKEYCSHALCVLGFGAGRVYVMGDTEDTLDAGHSIVDEKGLKARYKIFKNEIVVKNIHHGDLVEVQIFSDQAPTEVDYSTCLKIRGILKAYTERAVYLAPEGMSCLEISYMKYRKIKKNFYFSGEIRSGSVLSIPPLSF